MDLAFTGLEDACAKVGLRIGGLCIGCGGEELHHGGIVARVVIVCRVFGSRRGRSVGLRCLVLQVVPVVVQVEGLASCRAQTNNTTCVSLSDSVRRERQDQVRGVLFVDADAGL